MNLTEKKYNEFFIGGKDGIFNITSTSSGIDKNKLNTSVSDQIIPYITRSEIDNGINLFISGEQNDKYSIDEGNVITIGLDTQTVFYQPHKFITGQNIQVLSHPRLNRNIALFIIPLIKIQMQKFNWGGNGATLGRLSRTKIMLPVDENDNPDWDFMEAYINEKYQVKKYEYQRYATRIINELKYVEIESLEKKEWREFFITSLFTNVQRGKRLTKENQIAGSMPYVSSTALTNGVDNFISNNQNVRIFNNCMTIANSGSVGASYYHSYEFVASDHVTHLKNDKMNKYIYLFIATLTNRFSEKYNFNREINDRRISREKIILPVNKKNEPDYEYMEQYIKNLMIKKYKQYLNN